MKLKSLFALTSLFLLASCNTAAQGSNTSSSSEDVKLKVISPTGAPAVAFYNHAEDTNYETNAAPANIVSFLNEQSPYDIVVIDTVSGLKAINNGAPFKMAATLTFGNFFIASTGNDENGHMDPGDKIVLFGQNQTPDLLFHDIYGHEYDSGIEYVKAVSDAAPCLASGKNADTKSDIDYVFLAQPVLFATLNNTAAPTYGKAAIYANIQQEYKAKHEDKELVQASLFVKNSAPKEAVDKYLSSLEKDINDALKNPNLIKDGMDKLNEDECKAKFGILSSPAKATVANGNSLGLGYKAAKENLASINSFISLFSVNAITEDVLY